LNLLAKVRLQAIYDKSRQRVAAGPIKREEASTLETLAGAMRFLDLEDRSREQADFWRYSLALDRVHKKNTPAMMSEML
jgi:hypothetical protein